MKDLNGMYRHLTNVAKEPKFIGTNETFTKEEFLKLISIYKNSNKTKFMKCFENTEDSFSSDYLVPLQCGKCGEEKLIHLNKSGLFNQLKAISDSKKYEYLLYTCDKCKKELLTENTEQYEKIKQERKEVLFKVYLNPNNSWKPNIVIKNRIYKIKDYLQFVDSEEIKNYIHNIGYYQYLKTPLWDAVAGYKKYISPHCQLCGSSENLNVHHSNYTNLGYEAYNLNDLIVLCKECHYKFHDKIENLDKGEE